MTRTGASAGPCWPVCSCSRCASTPRAEWASATPRLSTRVTRCIHNRCTSIIRGSSVYSARLLGRRAASPSAAHAVTALLATLVPWVGALAARAAGATWAGAGVAAFSLVLVPEMRRGAFWPHPRPTPDSPVVRRAGVPLPWPRREPGSLVALAAALASGVCMGLACDAKVSGFLAGGGNRRAWLSPRPSIIVAPWLLGLRSPWRWCCVAPVVIDEFERGFPMLRHRLVDTQKGAGPSLRNLGSLLGGQLDYLTPPALFGAFRVARDSLPFGETRTRSLACSGR